MVVDVVVVDVVVVVVDVVVVVVVVVVGRGGEGNSREYYRALWVDQVNMKL